MLVPDEDPLVDVMPVRLKPSTPIVRAVSFRETLGPERLSPWNAPPNLANGA
jgi:hypothetical protein